MPVGRTYWPYWIFLRAYLRLKLRMGDVVVIIAQTGNGKSFIAQKLTPSRIIDNTPKLFSTGPDSFIPSSSQKYPGIKSAEIPAGSFTVDNAAFHDENSLRNIISTCTTGFVLTFQALDQIRHKGLRDALLQRSVVFVQVDPRHEASMGKLQTWLLLTIGTAIGVWLGLHYPPFHN